MAKQKAPWTDFSGHDIYAGNVIQHPSGDTGQVVYDPSQKDELDQWRVEYTDGELARLCDQIGIKGQAKVFRSPDQN